MNLLPLKETAMEAALAAGRIIKSYLDTTIDVKVKPDGGSNYASQIVTKVDKECEDEILSYLLPTCEKHDIALLTEETEDNGSRFEKDYFWCVDPIDGTLALSRKIPDFSVSIALVSRAGTPVIGVIYDPSTETMYHAAKGHGVFKNDKLWKLPKPNNYLTHITDKPLTKTPRPDDLMRHLYHKVDELNLSGLKVIQGGGSVLNAIKVLQHAPANMIKHPKEEIGGGSLWDFAATACIFHELGFRATNFNGDPLDLNRKGSTFMHHEGIYYECVEY
ncbi:3'(2'),5'-bisphosphate nucleotidase CysQ family protein [Gracilimonas sp.]|uniref:3'(2'),5'-bisphosphate nucleotidase CysQ family protein n=1 Tax=Gracilimonas sp. TaxID=1974203 RepID=UPI003D12A5F6